MLRIDKNYVIKVVNKKGYKRVLFQGPDGLRNQLANLAKEISSKLAHVEIIIDGERDFGACDIPYDKAIKLGVDAIFHFGHIEFPATKEQLSVINGQVPVEYFPVYDDSRITTKIINELVSWLEEGVTAAIVYSLQYKRQFLEIVRYLDKIGIPLINTKARELGLDKWQIIGCNIGILERFVDETNCVIVVSGGLFHGLGVGLYSGLPTLVVDVPRGEVYNIERELKRYRSLIAYNISRVSECRNFGVIVSTKSFQYNYSTAKFIHEYLINNLEKNSVLLVMDFINNDILEYFPSLDAFIQTACPRISIDDLIGYKRPILNVEQFLIFIGKKKFEEVYPWKRQRLFQG